MDTKNKIIKLNGLIIGEKNYKEYDKLLTLLTKENGKIQVYAFGVRKQNSKNIGKVRLFSFGQFEVKYVKDMYTLESLIIDKTFDKIESDYDINCYASYFVELADYFGFENIESEDVYKLLFFSFRALDEGKMKCELIKLVFELKMLKYQGIYEEKPKFSDNATLYFVWEYILNNKCSGIFNFMLDDKILKLFEKEMDVEMQEKVGKKFKTLEFLK